MNEQPSSPAFLQRSTAPTEGEFQKLSGFLKRLTGIHLPMNQKNVALMSSRLQKLKAQGIPSYKELIQKLESHDKKVISRFVCAMTTNTTHFFREKQHFDYLQTFVQEKVTEKSNPELRIWCAASSTGEEPYGLAMVLSDLQTRFNFRFKILATDIDSVTLASAQAGVYDEKQIDGIPPPFLQRYFTKSENGEGAVYSANEALRGSIQFGRFNLLKNYPFKGKFDFIFCRNVLIYFDKETVNDVVTKMTQVLQPQGYLFLGHSEAIAGMMSGLKRAGPAVYRWEGRASSTTGRGTSVA